MWLATAEVDVGARVAYKAAANDVLVSFASVTQDVVLGFVFGEDFLDLLFKTRPCFLDVG